MQQNNLMNGNNVCFQNYQNNNQFYPNYQYNQMNNQSNLLFQNYQMNNPNKQINQNDMMNNHFHQMNPNNTMNNIYIQNNNMAHNNIMNNQFNPMNHVEPNIMANSFGQKSLINQNQQDLMKSFFTHNNENLINILSSGGVNYEKNIQNLKEHNINTIKNDNNCINNEKIKNIEDLNKNSNSSSGSIKNFDNINTKKISDLNQNNNSSNTSSLNSIDLNGINTNNTMYEKGKVEKD